MACAQSTMGAPYGIAGRISAFVAQVNEHRERRKVFRTTYRELNRLSDRELVDLGIRRSMIHHLASEAAKAA